ncbi:hypothetical protein MSAN_02428600 [Mycena sanguinolenta]|uniref:Secreted protein n=1 Tax=Mycena sanguinolenta TaxID=230812 RepID=A0A8H6X371_9AGAR|nr:hypothetical protein MSAN_02428600 [Mycena sanguinolenta]
MQPPPPPFSMLWADWLVLALCASIPPRGLRQDPVCFIDSSASSQRHYNPLHPLEFGTALHEHLGAGNLEQSEPMTFGSVRLESLHECSFNSHFHQISRKLKQRRAPFAHGSTTGSSVFTASPVLDEVDWPGRMQCRCTSVYLRGTQVSGDEVGGVIRCTRTDDTLLALWNVLDGASMARCALADLRLDLPVVHGAAGVFAAMHFFVSRLVSSFRILRGCTDPARRKYA